MSQNNPMLESALRYAAAGLAVFPVRFKRKEPAISNGFKSATTDLEQIKKWWGQPPGDKNNIGIATGAVSGNLVVIDIDKSDKKDGYQFFSEWLDKYGALPETTAAVTGSGGMHLLFRSEQPEKSRTGIYPGIDIRAEGGYIVAPPSLHPNGQTYQWERDITHGIAQADANVLAFLHPLEDLEHNTFEMPEMIPEGERNRTLFAAACSMRDKDFGKESILASIRAENQKKCAPPLEDKEVQAIVRSALKYEPEHSYTATAKNGKTVPADKEPPPLETYTAAELLKMDLKPPRMIVNNLFPEGVCILSAPSKMGKSWFALDMGLSVIKGEPVMGFTTNRCDVIYFALEDSWTRLQRRLKKLTGATDVPEGLTLVTKCEPIHKGFLKQLEQEIKKWPDAGLVIVDTLQKVKPPSDAKKTAYEQDYQVFGEISKLAFQYHVCILFLHHNRKSNGFDGDPFEDILGSTALQGATDVMCVIKKKKRTDEEATFYATGRDIDQQDLIIQFNKATCRWKNLGDAGSIEQLRAEMEYRNHPAMVTLHYKLDCIEQDPNEPIKEYVARMKDFQADVLAYTHEFIGTSERNFGTIVSRFDPYLLKDKIKHIAPETTTVHKGKRGRFHRYRKQC